MKAHEILNEVFREKTRRNPSYSLRAMARDLEVTHGFLSLLLQGKKRIAFKRAVRFCQALQLDEHHSSLLLKAVAVDSARDAEGRAFLESLLAGANGASAGSADYAVLELERFRVLSGWHHVAILDLTLLRDFRPDPKWVARRLGISVMEVEAAVQRLERLGLLEKKDGTWVKTRARLAVPTGRPEPAIREFHDQMITKALDSLHSTDPEEFNRRDVTGVTIAGDPKRFAEARRRIEVFRREMLEFLGQGERTELFQMNIQMFRLTRDGTGND